MRGEHNRGGDTQTPGSFPFRLSVWLTSCLSWYVPSLGYLPSWQVRTEMPHPVATLLCTSLIPSLIPFAPQSLRRVQHLSYLYNRATSRLLLQNMANRTPSHTEGTRMPTQRPTFLDRVATPLPPCTHGCSPVGVSAVSPITTPRHLSLPSSVSGLKPEQCSAVTP